MTHYDIDFGKGDIRKIFNAIFYPTLLGMVFTMAFIITDGIFVGHGIGPNGLAAVNLVGPVMMLMTGLGMMFGTGCSVAAAIQLSRGNEEAAGRDITRAFLSSVLMALTLSIVLYAFPDSVLRLLGTSEEIIPMARKYLFWFIPTCIFIMVQIVGEFVIRLDGSPKYAMYANIIPAVINMILDYVFIFICKWGLMGAAFATTIGTGVGASISLYYFIRKSRKLKFCRLKISEAGLAGELRSIGNIIKLGFPGFLGEFALSIMTLCGNLAFGRHLGDNGIAAYSVICYLYPVVVNVYYAVSSAAQPIISFNHGAGDAARVQKTFSYSLKISIVFALAMTFLCFLIAPSVISVFLSPDAEAYTLAVKGLPLFAIGYVMSAYNVCAIGYYQSIERSTLSIGLMLLRGVVFQILFFLLLPALFGAAGLWLAVPASEALTALLARVRIRRVSVAAVIIALFFVTDADACTTAIVGPKASSSGKAILWKQRDGGNPHNVLEHRPASSGQYAYTGIFNAADTARLSCWGGSNEVGFSIVNNMSFNVSEGNASSENGRIIAEALTKCVTVNDFEAYLKARRSLKCSANYAVIDSLGNGAYFEVSSAVFKRYDVPEDGYLVRSNFSFAGDPDGPLGYDRYLAADEIMKKHKKYSPAMLFDKLGRSYYNAHTGCDIFRIRRFHSVLDDGFISRPSTVSSICMEGKDLIWVAIGSTANCFCVPVWVSAADKFPSFLSANPENGRADACDLALKVLNYNHSFPRDSKLRYLDLDKARASMSIVRKYERKAFRIGKFASVKGDMPNAGQLRSLNGQLEDLYADFKKEILSFLSE